MGQKRSHKLFIKLKFFTILVLGMVLIYGMMITPSKSNEQTLQNQIKLVSLSTPAIQTHVKINISLSSLIIHKLRERKGQNKNTKYQALLSFYQDAENQPIWISGANLNDRAKSLIITLQHSDEYGLNPQNFIIPTSDNTIGTPHALANLELILSQALLKYAEQARGSRMLRAGLNHFFDLYPTLDTPLDILEIAANSENITSFLLDLHPEHKQFTALRHALLKHQDRYKKKPSAKLQKIIVKLQMNMERWRVMPDDMANGVGIFVWTNIPELKTRIVQRDQIIFTEKAIVGKVSKQTPIFKDQLEWIEFFPTWYIPNSIKRNDLLPRLRRGNTKTLEKFNIKVDCGVHGRNPKTINWKKVDIRSCSVTQPPSRINVLGNLKFKFPNKHSVYMHDTDDRHLFKAKHRYMSHGCVRVQHPDKMAQLLLSHARGTQAPDVKRILSGRRAMRKEVFSKPIPVYMTYFTMRVDKNGKLKSLPDVYGHDRRMAHLFTRNKALFPAPKVARYKRPKPKVKQVTNNWRKEAF